DLANLVNEAALLAARRGKKTIEQEELEEGIMRVIAGPEKKTRLFSEEERRITAYHELGHAIVGHYMDQESDVHKISIIGRGQAMSAEPEYSEEIAREIDDEIRRIIEEAHDTATQVLREHMEELHRISMILIERETIDKEQFERLLAGELEEAVFPDEAPEAVPAPADEKKKQPAPKPRPFPIPGATMQPPPKPEGAN